MQRLCCTNMFLGVLKKRKKNNTAFPTALSWKCYPKWHRQLGNVKCFHQSFSVWFPSVRRFDLTVAGEAKVHIPLVITIANKSSCIVAIIMLHSGSIAPIRVYTAQNNRIFSLQLEYLPLKINSVIWYRLTFVKARTPARCATLWLCGRITRSFFLIVTWFKRSLAVAQQLAAKACKGPESALGFVASHVTKCLFHLSLEWVFGGPSSRFFPARVIGVCTVFGRGLVMVECGSGVTALGFSDIQI